ncbi:tRNA (guanosine(37)-N1)-methyltransferase TrmD [Ectothiorhodospiraceae bacterium 2226]|nr:tRNA (guanosine(37)-N1)-methyltransferase TrmD [Ectothiorhodospiraceae bacterium 2226]
MRIEVVTLFPGMFDALEQYGVVGRALRSRRLQLATWNPREDARDRHRTVDDRPYGGGPGMVMRVEPLRTTIGKARAAAGSGTRVLYMSPQGRRLDQAGAAELAQREALVLVCGRYEGVDERLIEQVVDEEWSIGDYVLSGGELAAMVLVDAVARLLPGVLGDSESAEADSFVQGLLDHPHYTRPECVDGREVPPVLLGGDHAAIRRWRLKQALGRTWLRRPDLLDGRELDEEQQTLLQEFKREYGSRGDV